MPRCGSPRCGDSMKSFQQLTGFYKPSCSLGSNRVISHLQWLERPDGTRWEVSGPGSHVESVIRPDDPGVKSTLERLLKARSKDGVFTPRFRAGTGKIERAVVVPVYRRDSFLGFVISTFDEQCAIQDVLSDNLGQGYGIAIFEGSEEIYRLPGSNSKYEKQWGQDSELQLPGAAWRVRVWPKPEMLSEIESRLSLLGLITGAVTGLLLFLALDSSRISNRNAQALRVRQQRFLDLIACAMDAIVSVHESQRIVMFNRAAEKIFRCPSSLAIGQPLSNFIPEKFREVHWQHIQNFGRTGITSRSMGSPGTVCALRADGEEFPAEASISRTESAIEKLYTVILRDISLRKRAEEELRQARDELESRVKERTAELQFANEKLESENQERRRAEESLRELSGRILRLRDDEQRRIARELHDSTAQILGSLAMDLERVQQLVPAGDKSKAQELLVQCSELLEKATAEIRTISYLLHPPMLDDLGLEGVLPWYAAGFSERTGIRVKVDLQPSLGRLPQEIELSVFRLVQESLTNIHRHSGSQTAEIAVFKDAQTVRLEIADRGHGIWPGIVEKIRNAGATVGIGISSMRERVYELRGSIEIVSSGGGTTIKVTLPIDSPRLASEQEDNRQDTDFHLASC